MHCKIKKLYSVLLLVFSTFLFSLVSFVPAFADDTPTYKNILILNSYQKGFPWTDDQTDGIISMIKADDMKTDIYVEYMDWKRYPTSENLENIYSNLKLKYSNKKLDLVIATDDAALDFALKNRSDILSNAPIIFSGVNDESFIKIAPRYDRLTGVLEQTDTKNTIKLAKSLNSSLKKVYLIYDNTESGLSAGNAAVNEIRAVDPSMNIVPLNNKTYKEILMDAKSLNNDSIILLTTYSMDSENNIIDNLEFCKLLSINSSVPIYHLYDFAIGNGSIGGYMSSGKLEGKAAASLALRVLQGENINSIPISADKVSKAVLDYNQLTKFQISLSKVPTGVEIVNKPFSFIEAYKPLVFSSLSILIVLTVFIIALITYIHRIRSMKIEIEEDHEELTQLYEELAATDEEIRAQYDELNCTQGILSESEERYRLVLEASNDVFWDYDLRKNKIFISDKWYELLGYIPEECEYTLDFWLNLFHPDDVTALYSSAGYHVEHLTYGFECDFKIKKKNNEYICFRCKGRAQFDSDKKPYRITGTNMDMTEIEAYQEELKYVAFHDSLTGLSNRLDLYNQIDTHLTELKNPSSMEAMLFIDTDNFKFVNDTMGHSMGDSLLLELSMRLLSYAHENCLLFRLGGDEFILYLKNVNNKAQVETYVTNIIKAFNEPFNIDGNIISTSLSIGISLFPVDGNNVDTLLRCSDIAMYKVKENGKNGFCFYNSIISDEIFARVNIEKHLKAGLENNEFIVYNQPQINVKSKTIDGFEALVRWQNPDLGLVSPENFINIAEETGFIIPLGEWILRTSCKFIQAINKLKSSEYKISVNISVIQLLQDNFTDILEKVLLDTGLSPALLELEITESVIMDSPELIVDKLKLLREKGISIALDDFGTGYSSLAYLRTIPISTLKIDKMFIDDISGSECETSLTDSIIDLGHKIGLTIVAEGVESNYQLEYLECNHCDKIQGYLFSKPLPSSEIEKIL